jgi:hypothetical protein
MLLKQLFDYFAQFGCHAPWPPFLHVTTLRRLLLCRFLLELKGERSAPEARRCFGHVSPERMENARLFMAAERLVPSEGRAVQEKGGPVVEPAWSEQDILCLLQKHSVDLYLLSGDSGP